MRYGSVRRGLSLLAAVLALGGLFWFAGDDWWLLGLISAGVVVVGGAGRLLWRPAPWALSGLVIAVYLGVVAWMGIDVGRCPDCDAGDGWDRMGYFTIWSIFFGMIAAWLFTCIALGALLAGRLRQL